jgi:hypothetical protein
MDYTPYNGGVLDLGGYADPSYATTFRDDIDGQLPGYFIRTEAGIQRLDPDSITRAARYTDYDFSWINDPNSPIRQALKVDPYWYGRQVTLWGGTPYTIKGADDPVAWALNLRDMGVPADQLAGLLGPSYASQIPLMLQVYSGTEAHNAATRDSESRLLGLPTPFVLAFASMGLGGFLGAGAAALETAGGATGALGTAEAVGAGGALATEGGALTAVEVGLGGVAGGAPELAAAESFLGPTTGTVLESGVQASGAIVTPVGTAGLPVVSGIAVGSGAFLPPALEQLGGADLLDKGLAALKAAGAKLLQQTLAPKSAPAVTSPGQPAPGPSLGGDPVTVLLLAGLAVLAIMR